MIEDLVFNLNDQVFHYRKCGDPKNPPMLFLAGWPGIFLEKSGVLQELAKHFYVISPEHPGLLRTKPLDHYTNIFEQYADLYRMVLKKEKLDTKKLVIMGQSFGGGIASFYSYKYSQYIKTLILTDSVIGAGKIAFYVKFLFRVGPKLTRMYAFLPSWVQKKVAFSLYGVPQELFNQKTLPERQEMLENYTYVVTAAWDNNEKLIDKNYGDFPILFVWGDRDGKEFNLYGSCNVDEARIAAESLKRKGKNIKFVTVNGGHTILYQNPIYVIDEIRKNLD